MALYTVFSRFAGGFNTWITHELFCVVVVSELDSAAFAHFAEKGHFGNETYQTS